jgi:anaerobic selenocysteine-containing dehydrogenase
MKITIKSVFEPYTSPDSRPDLAKEYPLTLITGARIRYFVHSQYRNLPSLRKRHPDPLVEINTRTAKELGITNEDMVRVETPIGFIKLKAKVTPDIHPQVVQIYAGWGGEVNVNILLDDQKRDPFTGYAEQNTALCRVSRI